jgi:iron complex outermembrane receptor protein
VNHFRLSETFEPVPENPQEKGNRLYSDSKDLKLTLMAGITPFEPLDIWLTYTYQDADKGVSPPDIRVRQSSPDFVIWDWPLWKRQGVSLNGTFNREVFLVTALLYFDKYDNRLDEYNSIKHYELGIHAPHSDYDEYSLGGRITGTWYINQWNEVEAALTYKKEDHKGLKGGYTGFPDEDTMTEIVHINEDTWSFGAEWSTNPWRPFTFKAGFGFNALAPIEYWGQENEFSQWIQAGYYTVRTGLMFLYTWQAGVFYDITPHHQVHLTYARKNHFPNMSQRYSTRFGRNLPNPGLGPEIANHFELGYAGALFDSFTINTALYYNLMTGKIVDVEVPDPTHPSSQLNYARNLDATSFFGFEAVPAFSPNKYLSCALAFSVNGYYLNHSQDADIKALSYYPLLTINAYMEIKPIPEPLSAWTQLRQLTIIPRIEYISNRWADSAGIEELPGYVLLHLKVSADITKYCTLSLGLENILDTYYEIRYNSPMAGRTFSLSVTGRY